MKPNLNPLNLKTKADQKIYKKARAIAYNYLSYRSRSRGEVLSKLVSKNIDKKYIDKILIDLENKGFIDDISFAYNYINYCIRNKLYSKKIIKGKLIKFLIPENIIIRTLSQLYTYEIEIKILKYLVQKKTRGIKKINSLEKRKLVNYLYKYGFDLDKIKDVIFEF